MALTEDLEYRKLVLLGHFYGRFHGVSFLDRDSPGFRSLQCMKKAVSAKLVFDGKIKGTKFR